MKRVALKIVIGCIFVIHSSLTNLVSAEEEYEIFEIGETGHQLKFLMSQEEIRKIQRNNKNSKISKQQRSVSPKRWVEKYEFGETGEIIVFPMNLEEIKKAKQRANRKKVNSSSKLSAKESEVIEMGDGHTISFKKS